MAAAVCFGGEGLAVGEAHGNDCTRDFRADAACAGNLFTLAPALWSSIPFFAFALMHCASTSLRIRQIHFFAGKAAAQTFLIQTPHSHSFCLPGGGRHGAAGHWRPRQAHSDLGHAQGQTAQDSDPTETCVLSRSPIFFRGLCSTVLQLTCAHLGVPPLIANAWFWPLLSINACSLYISSFSERSLGLHKGARVGERFLVTDRPAYAHHKLAWVPGIFL